MPTLVTDGSRYGWAIEHSKRIGAGFEDPVTALVAGAISQKAHCACAALCFKLDHTTNVNGPLDFK